jgi:hypothetical protein
LLQGNGKQCNLKESRYIYGNQTETGGHIAKTRTIENLETLLFWILVGRNQIGRPFRRWKDAIKVDATEIVRRKVNCFYYTQDYGKLLRKR